MLGQALPLRLYPVALATATVGWWAAIALSPEVRRWFVWSSVPESVLWAFLLADLAFLVGMPVAYACSRSPSWWVAHFWGASYATATTLSLSLFCGGGWLGSALMCVATVLSYAQLREVERRSNKTVSLFELPRGVIESRSPALMPNLLKTLLQVAIMWAVFLAILPAAILEAERRVAAPAFTPLPPPVAWIPFGLFGAIGLYCGGLFVIHGKGTPLPLDAATRFIVLGPYRWIRNPMATLGIAQGVIVGAAMGSYGVIAYSLLGAVVWHLTARPWEERDLEARFGESYRDYRRSVRNWIPRLRPYPKVAGMDRRIPPTD
ncbi:MAG: hypothetical protein KIS66_07160 [Fimbriimonadaceae bacterium]|nr:hypothetical protein [Fimbriimonadaceae bacterium]